MTKKVALIACSNGYGHVRRLLLLAQALYRNNAHPTLFAPRQAVHRFIETELLEETDFIDFDSETTIARWLDGTAQNWYKKLPDLSQYDVIVSDNLVEVLYRYPNAWLSGSFFWHESLENFPADIKAESRQLLKQTSPRMISSSLFVSPELKQYIQLHEVGLYVNSQPRPQLTNQKDILIASGRGGKVEAVAKDFVQSLVSMRHRDFNSLWVDPCLLPDKFPEWMKPATFNQHMYSQIAVAVIRPGVGTVTDALINGARIFPFYENNNHEMEKNVQSLARSGLSEVTCEIQEAWGRAMSYLSNQEMQQRHKDKINSLNLDGANEAARLIAC